MNENFINIETKLYKVFYIVCKTLNYSEAAKILCMTQPAVSYNIKKLEEKLDTILFIRKNNGIELTNEAEILFPYVEDALSSLNIGEQKINSLINLSSGTISIGIPSHIGVFLIVEIIKKFNQEFPNINFRIISKSTNELFRLLHNNSIDMIIDSAPIETTYDFSVRKIGEVQGIFTCHKSKNDLLNRNVSLKELVKYPLIVPSSTSSTTKRLKEMLKEQNIDLNFQFEVSTSDLIANMVDKNIGIGFLLENTIYLYNNICKINIIENLPSFAIYEIHKNNNMTKLVKIFIDYIDKSLEKKI